MGNTKVKEALQQSYYALALITALHKADRDKHTLNSLFLVQELAQKLEKSGLRCSELMELLKAIDAICNASVHHKAWHDLLLELQSAASDFVVSFELTEDFEKSYAELLEDKEQ